MDVTELVPGDVVDLQLGQVVPADLRLLAVAGLECDESVLTGESLPAEKSAGPVATGTPLAELSSCALMGTVVRAGSGTGVVVATGGDAGFGRIAVSLGQQQPETEFQAGLRKFSMLLVQVAGALTGAIFIINVALHKPVLDALLFSLAIFDFITFGVMLWVFQAGPALFRSGWFVESLATQTLVIFAIRTRRIPFFRSRPSLTLTLAALAVVTVGMVLPFTPLAHLLASGPCPARSSCS